ncbi:hypothetical protein MIND_00864400 [Mycena indigotica]|uniref:F-box domain-containing protein n=1 Tax=Mycena indigotica TaxID=2126181 RepID=A0A8H6SGJ5_9AGAR|nr:uncharacterized protein MIND_00864400 [Mycena indigotica]KAF7299158.1 hypothetical protein MIND_00864400 [Mycena indigotica]
MLTPVPNRRASSPTRLRRDIEAQIMALDVSIKEIQLKLSDLQLQRAALVSEVDQLAIDFSTPIHLLPPEIIGEIFQYFQPYFSSSLLTDAESKQTARIPWFLGSVCHSWRQVAMSLPALWSVLNINDTPRYVDSPVWTGHEDGVARHTPQHWLTYLPSDDFEVELQQSPRDTTQEDFEGFYTENRLEIVKACLERSGTHGLSLRLRNMNVFASKFILDLLLQHARRWEQIFLVDPPLAVCLQIRNRRRLFPRLRHLTVEGPQWWSEQTTSILSALDSLLPGSASPLARVTEIKLFNIVLKEGSVPIQWSGIKKYSEVACYIDPSYRTIIFQQLVNLVSLSIQTISDFMWTEHILFPNLRYASFAYKQHGEFAVEGPILFEMPNLEDFSISAWRMRSLSDCVPRRSSHLRRLSVLLMCVDVCQGDTEQVFALFPELEDVSLWGSNYLTDSTLESLTPSPRRPYLLPRLETLCLSSTAFAHGECKWTTLLDMIHGRFGPLATTAALSRLRSLEYVYDPAGYDDEVGKALRTLQRQQGWDIRVRTNHHRILWTELGIQWLPSLTSEPTVWY